MSDGFSNVISSFMEFTKRLRKSLGALVTWRHGQEEGENTRIKKGLRTVAADPSAARLLCCRRIVAGGGGVSGIAAF